MTAGDVRDRARAPRSRCSPCCGARRTSSAVAEASASARDRVADRLARRHAGADGRDRGPTAGTCVTTTGAPEPGQCHRSDRARRARPCPGRTATKSKIPPFSSMRARWVDLVMAVTSCCKHQRSSTWAGARPTRSATRLTVPFGKMPAGPERTVRFDGDVGPPAGLEQRSSVLERTELHLVDRGRAGGSGEHGRAVRSR